MLYLLCGGMFVPNILYAQNDGTEPIAYDFEQGGIYYKFAPAPDGSYIDTSYKDADGNTVKDGIYTGLEKEEGDILWVTGKEYKKMYILIDPKRMIYDLKIINETYSGDVFIPDYVTYEGRQYPVKGICKDAFRYSNNEGEIKDYDNHVKYVANTRITSLRLPETLVYVDEYAFVANSPLPITKLPESIRYIGNHALDNIDAFSIKIPDNVLTLKAQSFYNNRTDVERRVFEYPRNAVYGGQISVPVYADEIVYPEKMRHLVSGEANSGKNGIVIPDNGDFYVHHFGLPARVSVIYSYAPIMRNCRPGYGFLKNQTSIGDIMIEPKMLYVLPGLKEAYAEEWPELLEGKPYYGYNYKAWKYEEMFFEEDHIIEVSREEMDTMVEAAGLTVPTAIREVQESPSRLVEEAVYTLDGRRWPTLQKGVNIVRRSDGTTKKVFVK